MGKRLLEALTWAGLAGLAALALFAMPASAEVLGSAVDGQLGLQTPVTQVAHEIHDFYDLVNFIIIAITSVRARP